jgi:hypothetical protein
MKITLFCLMLVVTTVTNAWADDASPASRADVTKLIELSGLLTAASNRFAETSTPRVMQKLKFRASQDLDQAEVAVFQACQTLFNEAARQPNGVLDRIVPVYQRFLTQQEVSVLLRFYQLDLATKLSRTATQINDEMREIAKDWAQPQGPEWEKRLHEAIAKQGIPFEVKSSSP